MSMNSAIACPFRPVGLGFVRDTMRFVGGSQIGHDRDAAVPDQPTATHDALSSPVLQEALANLRLEGAVFLRAEYREPWAYESLTGVDTAKILRPDTDRVILFHVV